MLHRVSSPAPRAPARRAIPLALGLALALGACTPRRLLVSPELAPAQAGLSVFAQALAAWNVGALDRLFVGGAAHPAWKLQKASFEGRGIRFQDVRVGAVRSLTSRIAVGAIRYRLSGYGVDDDKRARVSRVLLLRLPDGWRVTHWGTRVAVKRHLAWIAGGGDPLKDPFFQKLAERAAEEQRRLATPPMR